MVASIGGSQTSPAGYEQLLSIQQHQHMLALQQKDAEVAHMRACVELLETEQPSEEKHKLAAALRTKDEEAAIMMAAKHKELELMASLLQLREQQIEDLRQLCEAQQLEIQQLKRRRVAGAPPRDGGAPATFSRNGAHRSAMPLEEEPPSHEILGSPAGSMVMRRSPNTSSDDHAMQMEREVRRLRLKMEEMESAMNEHHARSAGLQETVALKTDRIQALEAQVRAMQAQEAWGSRASERDFARPAHLAASERDFARPAHLAACGAGDAGLRRGGAMAQSAPRLPSPMPETWGHGYGAEARRAGDCYGADARRPGECYPQSNELARDSAAGPMPTTARVAEPWAGEAAPAPPRQAAREAPWGSEGRGSEGRASEAGRQSQELLREMRRLRLQMSELERATGRTAEESAEPGPWPWRDARAAATTPLLAALRGSPSAPAFSPSPPAPPAPPARPAPRGDFAGWEYRPHAGDPTDAAVAALVNRPQGRYRGWRALLCRLEHGVYLCGTRRVRLRADAAAERIEASADGAAWADLEEMMRGAEASQHALLERARGASGHAACGRLLAD